MRVFKFILSVMLAIILVAAAGVAMASFTMTEAVSEEAIQKAVVETNAVDELTDRILMQSTTNMGGQYGQTMKEILKSDAMTDFFTAYTANCLQNQIKGNEGTAGSGYYDEIGSDDLNQAFSAGMDECISKGNLTMNEGEREIFDEALNAAMPDLTKGINYVIQQMNLTSFVHEDTAKRVEQAQIITSPTVRYGSIGIGLLACLGLILLRHHRRSGFLWCGVCLLLMAGLFYVISLMLSGTEESSGSFISLSARMMYVMLAYGTERIAIAGGVLGAACLPTCLIVKLVARKKAKRLYD